MQFRDLLTGPFQWYHRDEVSIAVVFLILIWFFSKSSTLSMIMLGIIGVAFLLLCSYRVVRMLAKRGRLPARPAGWVHGLERAMPRFPWDRSRIFLAFFSCVVLAPLCVHRLNLLLDGGEYAFPSDRYWTLFLGWYLLLWVVALAYLLFVWVREQRSGNRPHVPFFEGVVGSLFFYHGLPPKSRVVTFTAGFLLGGVPSYFAVHISPSDPAGFQIATWLIVPVAVLTIGGSLYTMRWLMEFERSAERSQAGPNTNTHARP